jgi:multidrug efflux system outer membrane protein
MPSNASAFLSWELDFLGKVRHENRAVQDELTGSEEGPKVILSNLVSDIVVAYFQLRDYDNLFAIAEKTLESRQKEYDIVYQRFKAGCVFDVDLIS